MNETLLSTRKVNGPDSDRCASCGQHLPPDAPPDTCPACALREALGLDGEAAASLVGQIFGDYELLKEIARGGMGVVFQARQISLRRIVALKMILAGRLANEADVKRFKSEAQAAAALKHPNIVAIHEVGEHEGQHFFSMDFVEGRSLAERVREKLPPARESARLLEKIARAVHFAHQRDIIHRDLKPSNVLVDEFGEPHLTDFGLAKVTSQPGQTLTGAILGTPGFMAPEQARGLPAEVVAASDVYSLGAILYHLLTGRPPYQGETPHAVIEATLHSDPVTPRALNASTPPDLETICLKCLDHEPHRRYATAEALADDLARWQRHEPILAKRVGPFVRLRKWARRNPAIAAAAAALVIGSGVAIWQAVRASNAEGNALAALADKEKARSAEAKAKELAQENELESRAVLQFVRDKIFAAARPEGKLGGLGREVTVRRAMKAALADVETSFTNQPLIEARLRETMGKSLLYLGEADIATEQFEATRGILARMRGPDHPDTLRSMNDLAAGYAALGRDKDALKLHEETLALKKAKLGPNDPETLVSMNNVARGFAALGHYDEALKLDQNTLTLAKALFGPDHAQTLASMSNLARDYAALRQYDEALKLDEESFALKKAKFGLEHPETLTARHNLAGSYAGLGRPADALKLSQENLGLMQTKLGPDHPDTLLGMNNVARAYAALGRPAEALKLDEEIFLLMKAKLGPDHADTLRSMSNLAASYAALGGFEDALRLDQETFTLTKAKLGPDHPDTLRCMSSLADSYAELGRSEDALKLNEETLALRTARLGPDHPDTLVSMNNLADSYRSRGRHDDALKLNQETLALRKAKLGPDHPDTFFSMNNLARNYAAVGRPADAFKLDEETFARMKAKLGPDHPDTLRSMSNLASSHAALGQPDAALKLREEVLALRKAKLGPDHPDTVRSMSVLSTDYIGMKRFSEAEQVLKELLKSQRKKLPVGSEKLSGTLDLLGTCLLKQDKHAEAATVLQECVSISTNRSPADWTTFKVKVRLGAALFGQNKYAEAEAELRQGYEGLKQRESKIPASSRTRYLNEAAGHLVKLYTEWGQTEKAAEWQQKFPQLDQADVTANKPASGPKKED